jgi:hypothetical protein
MVWFYERGRETLILETRFDSGDNTFLLIWTKPEGITTSERFGTQQEFQARLTQIESRLNDEHWMRSGPPAILPDGWKP